MATIIESYRIDLPIAKSLKSIFVYILLFQPGIISRAVLDFSSANVQGQMWAWGEGGGAFMSLHHML